MASNIIISKNSGLNDDFWKVDAQVLAAVLYDINNEQSGYDKFVKDVFNEKDSKKYAEKLGSQTALGNFSVVAEGGKPEKDDIREGFSKLIEHAQFGLTVEITRQMKEDAQIDEMKQIVANLGNSYKRSRAEFASLALTSDGEEFTYGGKKFDRTTGDGKALFATDHPGKLDGVAAQSNVFTNAFGEGTKMLNRLANIGRNFKNQSGHTQGYTFDTIVIPCNVPELEDLILRVIRTELMVGNNNNDVNTQKGKWKLIVDPMWEVTDGSQPYILMSSEANKALRGNLFYDRVPLDVLSKVDEESRNLLWNGYTRFSAGFNDWRHVIMGGAKLGTTLE